jgi:hypothetical protein
MSKLAWQLSFTIAYKALFAKWQWEDNRTVNALADRAAVGFGNFVHNCAVAGALMAAEDRGWNRGQGEGFDAGVAHERHYAWARTQEDRW